MRGSGAGGGAVGELAAFREGEEAPRTPAAVGGDVERTSLDRVTTVGHTAWFLPANGNGGELILHSILSL